MSRPRDVRAALVLSSLVVAAAGCGFEPRIEKPGGFDTGISLRENVDDYVLARVLDDSPGFAVLLIQDGEKVVESTYGRVRRDEPAAVTSSTPFYLADLSMQFTVVATLMLCEDGVLSLETRAVDVLPDLPAAWDQITVHDLLAHESGIPDYTTQLDSLGPGPTNEMVLEAAADSPLRFGPGARFELSRTGYVLLAQIVEEVGGEPFADFVQENIFDPLGMASSVVVDETGPDVPGHAVGYATLDSIADYEGHSTGDAGVFATLEDMEAWLRALDDGMLLTPSVAELMYRGNTANSFGYGWYVASWKESPAYFLDGSEAGFHTFVGTVPDEHIAYVLLASGTYTWVFDLPSLMLGYLLGF
ncbi:MAG: serine hydrolase domain-containing protein [Gemmatimonadota bacterium]